MYHIFQTSVHTFIDLFSLAGGGGSGGGGQSDPVFDSMFVLFAIGFLPMSFIGGLLRAKIKNTLIALIVTLCVSVFAGLIVWSFKDIWYFVGVGVFLGGIFGFITNSKKITRKFKRKTEKEIHLAESKDMTWDLDKLNLRVQDVFMDFQKDWSDFNINNMKTYLSANYMNHISLMMLAIKQRKRRNQVDKPKLLEWFAVDAEDLADNSQDRVKFHIRAKASDKLYEIDDKIENLLFERNVEFQEYWYFVRNNDRWLLDGISQLTEDKSLIKADIVDFATKNGLFYNPDWGSLLLPKRGYLFHGSKFGSADINNHVIGLHKGLLVELYTYSDDQVINFQNLYNVYVIAQIALPKSYGSIIVESKKQGKPFLRYLKRTPKGYNKISLEWSEFNSKYNVYATNVEQVTAFELLHPVYMEKLFALPFRVSIEVVDNVVYLYTFDTAADYATMYNILIDAFKEMKL